MEGLADLRTLMVQWTLDPVLFPTLNDVIPKPWVMLLQTVQKMQASPVCQPRKQSFFYFPSHFFTTEYGFSTIVFCKRATLDRVFTTCHALWIPCWRSWRIFGSLDALFFEHFFPTVWFSWLFFYIAARLAVYGKRRCYSSAARRSCHWHSHNVLFFRFQIWVSHADPHFLMVAFCGHNGWSTLSSWWWRWTPFHFQAPAPSKG